MSIGRFSRTELLLGAEAMEKLKRARVNINRQIIAMDGAVGRPKAEAARDRVCEISPETLVRVYDVFYTPETAGLFDFSEYDYVVDAIDTVKGKLELAARAKEAGVPIISSMGAGNKLDPTAFRVADISKTKVCPLARIMRKELKKRGIYSLKVVYSEEPPMEPAAPEGEEPEAGRRSIPGSVGRGAHNSRGGRKRPCRCAERIPGRKRKKERMTMRHPLAFISGRLRVPNPRSARGLNRNTLG